MRNQYDPPAHYGIPNPLGPRLHNWRGGPWDEGSLYHGPIYTRPSYNITKIVRPLFGVGVTQEEFEATRKREETLKTLGAVALLVAVIYVGEKYFPQKGFR